jgi:hypothetical protein
MLTTEERKSISALKRVRQSGSESTQRSSTSYQVRLEGTKHKQIKKTETLVT